MPPKIKNLFAHVMAHCDRSGGKDACWPWLRSCNRKNGYGRVKFDGKQQLTHRIVWSHARRREVPPGRRILHRCDNPPCCNPRHLFLGTQADNIRDMIAKGRARRIPSLGEANGMALLTAEAVRAIYADNRPHIAIAAQHGVSISCVRQIKRGVRWAHIKRGPKPPRLIPERVRLIRAATGSLKEIARAFGLSKSGVWGIRNTTWKDAA